MKEILDNNSAPEVKSLYSNTLRKTVFTIEVLFWVVFSIGLLFKAMSVPNAIEIIILSTTIMCGFYILMLHVLANARNIGNIIYGFVIGFFMTPIIMAILFRVLSWTYNEEMFYSASASFILAFFLNGLLWLIYQKQKPAAFFYSRLLIRFCLVYVFLVAYKLVF